jgi:hypothetical protein
MWVELACDLFILIYLFVAWSWDLPPDSLLKRFWAGRELYVILPGLWHSWAMFADPPGFSCKLTADVTLDSGLTETWTQPDLSRMGFVEALIRARERKYFENITWGAYGVFRAELADFIARSFLAQGKRPLKIVFVKLQQDTSWPPGEPAPLQRTVLSEHVFPENPAA